MMYIIIGFCAIVVNDSIQSTTHTALNAPPPTLLSPHNCYLPNLTLSVGNGPGQLTQNPNKWVEIHALSRNGASAVCWSGPAGGAENLRYRSLQHYNFRQYTWFMYYKLAAPKYYFFWPAFDTRILTPWSRKPGYGLLLGCRSPLDAGHEKKLFFMLFLLKKPWNRRLTVVPGIAIDRAWST